MEKTKWLEVLDELEEIRQVACEKKIDVRTVIDSCMECVKNADIPDDAKVFLLEKMEETKKRAKDRPLAYPADFMARCFSADAAKLAGYESRVDWTELLKKDHDSKYAGRIEGRTGAFYL